MFKMMEPDDLQNFKECLKKRSLRNKAILDYGIDSYGHQGEGCLPAFYEIVTTQILLVEPLGSLAFKMVQVRQLENKQQVTKRSTFSLSNSGISRSIHSLLLDLVGAIPLRKFSYINCCRMWETIKKKDEKMPSRRSRFQKMRENNVNNVTNEVHFHSVDQAYLEVDIPDYPTWWEPFD
ncbi:hypothetical protein F511_33849 [Dorcoceras hygrometricum]|uniref:Uncharacterized protein n=1 Tax=Dorcoceras hygrometricum TaxID=472368 RepID=A0A2Z7BN88_9LAMI|nr:hypothetical protein F511_33849 [Dorcoceras hygrometricum]